MMSWEEFLNDEGVELDECNARSAGCIEDADDSILVEQILGRLDRLSRSGTISPVKQTMFLLTQVLGSGEVALIYNVTQRWVQMSNKQVVKIIRRDMNFNE